MAGGGLIQVLGAMVKTEALETFAQSFVLPGIRERIIHEATKRPEKLLQRICHDIQDMFSPALARCSVSYEESDECYLLIGPRGFTKTTWAKASRNMGLGEGCLIIDATGTTFYAESEAASGSPSVAYSSGA